MIQNNEAGNKLTGFYKGRIIQHLPHGYCKIFIYGVYDDEWETKPDFLPPAEPAMSLYGGNCKQNGMFTYPCVGSMVWCFFENENQNLPVYFASIPGGPESKDQYTIIKPDAGGHESHVHRINSDHTNFTLWEKGALSANTNNFDVDTKLEMISRNNVINIKISKGNQNYSKLTMTGDGNIILENTNQLTITSKNIKLSSEIQFDINTPTININCKDNFNVKSPSITLDSSEGSTRILSKSFGYQNQSKTTMF